MFGIVHILAIDGFSRKIVGLIIILRKNPIDFYNALYRPLLLTEGIWEQIRVDHGTEFCMIGKVQQHISQYRNRTRRLPFLQNTSHCNHRVERLWVEVNQRINYFIKRILVSMKLMLFCHGIIIGYLEDEEEYLTN
uniref:Integrase core domain-containing protein n=1 Tax=Amphimedon queenslandica TaxID=400682 RepID=A0A1X7U0L1_AMPQE